MIEEELRAAMSRYASCIQSGGGEAKLENGDATSSASQSKQTVAAAPSGRSSWRRYHSIENSTGRSLQKLTLEVSARLGPDSEWIATEKVHGANCCIETDGELVNYASRTSVMGNGASFMNTGEVLPRYHPMVFKAFQLAKKEYPDLKRLLIYGEYFGGYYPGHPAEKGARKVQIGVAYSPANHFYAFDISVNGEGYLDFDRARALLVEAGFPLVATPLYRGTLQEMLAVDVETLKTTLPALLGHPPLDRFNIAEGIVIRPAREVFLNQDRAILKKKAQAFWEATNQPGQAMKVAQQAADNGQPASPELLVLDAAKSYINENRLRSVISKDRALLEEMQEHKLSGLLAKDALEDFQKEHGDELMALGKAIGNVRKGLMSFARYFVSEHIQTIRTELN